MRKLRVATRGSRLALWQTDAIASMLDAEVEVVVVRTAGDRTQVANTPIDTMRGRGVFVREVQAAVLEGRADFAVHSAKDLPSETAEGLALAAVVERGDPRDAIVGGSIESLPVGALVGTGSIRRRAQISWLRPDVTFANLRGNVETRLAKAVAFDAVVLAHAPFQRLNLDPPNTVPLSVDQFVPQVAQGALGIECRSDDARCLKMLAKIQHDVSRRAVDAERAFLAQLGGGCDLPVGAHATVEGGDVRMRAMLASLDGHVLLRTSGTARDGVTLGRELAEQLMYRDGGRELLFGHRPADMSVL